MRKIFLMLFLLFSYQTVLSLDSLVYKITITDDSGEKFDKLRFGVHVRATDDIDNDLGEKKLPELVPPSGIYSVFLVKSSNNDSTFWSYVDLRSFEDKPFLRVYHFKIDNLMNSFTLKWSEFGSEVDSVFLRDPFNGNIVNVNMKSKTSHYVENFSQNQFKIYVYYRPKITSIKEINVSRGEIVLYPNPARNYVKIDNDLIDIKEYTIINPLGYEVLKNKFEGELIDVGDLPKGVYLIRFIDIRNRVFVAKLMKE